MGYDITQQDDKWFCEQGTCYQSPNGTLTYAQCKVSCTQYPCSMFLEMCEDYAMVIAGNHPTYSSGNVSGLLGHWVNMYALPQMGGHNFTKPQLFAFIKKCCNRGSGTEKIIREVKDNYYNLPSLQNNIPNKDIVLANVISSRQSAYSIRNMNSPYLSTKNRVYRNEPPSTYDNQAITSMDNFYPYSND